jgi:4-hydroxy 2-oxovalerate aldolase
MKTTKHLDCTIRDGGYLNNWDFSFEFVYRLIRVLDEAGFDYAEIGFWNPKMREKLWRHCGIDVIKALDAKELSIKLTLLIDYGSCTIADIPSELREYVTLIRVATHKKDLEKAAEFAKEIKSLGFEVTVNAMGITSYDKADLIKLGNVAKQVEDFCDYFYLADSFGGLVPSEASRLYHFLNTVSDVCLGFHPHNNLELAVANTLSAIDAGVTIVDSSLLGLGRGGGNLRSEVIATVLVKEGAKHLNPLPLLSFADAMFETIGEKLGLAYDLESVISGMAKCHPNYAKSLIGRKRLSLDEVYAVIDSIPASIKSEFSESNVDKLINARFESEANSLVKYDFAILEKSNIPKRAFLFCKPNALVPELQSEVEMFSVNFISANKNVKTAIFGSLRRLWQNGDTLYGNSVDVYLASNSKLLKSLPNCKAIEIKTLETKIGHPIHNSGIKVLAILLNSGFKHVDVYGMAGFASPSSLVDETTNELVVKEMEIEARKELQIVRNAFLNNDVSFTIHDSILSNESLV